MNSIDQNSINKLRLEYGASIQSISYTSQLSIHPTNQPSNQLTIYPINYPSICLVHPFSNSFIDTFLYPLTHPASQSIHPYIRPSIHPSIHPYLHQSVCISLCLSRSFYISIYLNFYLKLEKGKDEKGQLCQRGTRKRPWQITEGDTVPNIDRKRDRCRENRRYTPYCFSDHE